MKEFYLVWGRKTKQIRYEHESLESAEKEAIRLTKQEGRDFIVLKSVSFVECIPHIRRVDK